jgi:HlyD family secretion protein
MKRRLLLAAVVVAAAVGGTLWWFERREEAPQELTLYGNVDLRQVSLAFNGSERIHAVFAEEGDFVREGQVLAELDTSLLEPQVAQAEAQVAAQRAVVQRLHNGSRPEEIAQARATLAAAKADALDARLQHQRYLSLAERKLASQQEVDSAKAAMDAAEARVDSAQEALELEIVGPREEDIAQAEAELRAAEAQHALLGRRLEDATLVAPLDGVVRARLLEPGDMASPQSPVFSLALIHRKWIRVYVSETDLGRVRPGLAAYVVVDSFPDRRFEGRIGFISPVAEFTPKTVETQNLRTSLVYETRVLVDDSADVLRLGMPATVHVPFDQPAPRGRPASGAASPSSSSQNGV